MKISVTKTTRMYRQLSLTTLTIIITIIQMNSNDNSYVLCDFTYGYETDDFTLAIINLTYTDPHTGVQHSEYEEYGKYSIGRIGSVSGRMIHVSSNGRQTHDACEPIDADIYPPEPWIALAQYGNCRDSVKLKNIAATNASAAIIYNNRAGTRLIKMHHKESSAKSYYEYQEVSVSGLEIWHFASNLISVFISKEKGESLAAMVDNGTRVMVQISIGTHSAMRYANINRTSVLFVSISFIVLMIISLAWLIFYYVQRFRYIHAKDILARRLNSAAKKAMDKIPTKTIRPADLERIFEGEFAELCPVCIDTFKTCDIIRILPCKHLFHKSCVDPWLLENRSCPMCKMDILKYYGLVFAGSQESILNIDVDLDVNQHYWHQHQQHRGRHRSGSGSDDIEVVHIPISSPMARNNRRHRQHRRCRSSNSGGDANQSLQSQSPTSFSTPDIVSDADNGSKPLNLNLLDTTPGAGGPHGLDGEVVINIVTTGAAAEENCHNANDNCANRSAGDSNSIGGSVAQVVDDHTDDYSDDMDDCRRPLSPVTTDTSAAPVGAQESHNNSNHSKTDGNSCSYDRLCSDEKY